MKTNKSTEGEGRADRGETSNQSRKPRIAPNKLSDERLQERARAIAVSGVVIYSETVRRSGSGYFYVTTKCTFRGRVAEKELRNMEKRLRRSASVRLSGAQRRNTRKLILRA